MATEQAAKHRAVNPGYKYTPRKSGDIPRRRRGTRNQVNYGTHEDSDFALDATHMHDVYRLQLAWAYGPNGTNLKRLTQDLSVALGDAIS